MGFMSIIKYFCRHFKCKCNSKCSLNEESGVIDRKIVKETSL